MALGDPGRVLPPGGRLGDLRPRGRRPGPHHLEYALASREVEPGRLVLHADHGCQYTSVKLTTRMVRAGVHASMGSVGDSYDCQSVGTGSRKDRGAQAVTV